MCSVYFYGQGTGDIYIQAECTFVSETYAITDKWYYTTTVRAMSQSTLSTGVYKDTFNNPVDLPSEFKLSVSLSFNSSNGLIAPIVGEDTSNYYYEGLLDNQKLVAIAISRNNTRAVLVNNNHRASSSDLTIEITYENGTQTLKVGGYTETTSNSEYSLSKFLGFIWGRGSTVNSITIDKL